MKKCTKCGIDKPLSEYHKHKGHKDGYNTICKLCKAVAMETYREANKEKVAAKQKAWYRANKEKVAAGKKAWREDNKEKEAARKKAWREANKEKIAARGKAWREAPCVNHNYYKQLVIPEDGARWVDDHLEVACKLCGKHFQPTNEQVSKRLKGVDYKDQTPGQSSFYCSDGCKNACPVYGFTPGVGHVDPRIRLPQAEAEEARACQTDYLKQIQCDKHGHNHCEKCGDIIDVELHHTLPVAQNGKEAINSAGHMLLCAGCHNEMHDTCGE